MLVMNPKTVFALNDQIVLQSIPELDHYYAFDIENGDQFQLNHTAHWVLQTVGAGIEWRELCETFADRYGLPTESFDQELLPVIQSALQSKILKEV